MGIRERGIGNMAFIAVLVLFVVAVALFFMSKDEANNNLAARNNALKERDEANKKVLAAQDAYKALLESTGLTDEALAQKGEDFPTGTAIRETVRLWAKGVSAAIAKAGECTLSTKHYTVPPGAPAQETQGENVLLKFYVQSQADDLLTMKGLVEAIPGSLTLASKIATENNQKYTTEVETYRQRVDELTKTNASNKTAYQSDVSSKQAALENAQGELSSTRDSLTNTSANLDKLNSDHENKIRDLLKVARLTEREKNAWQSRALNEKTRKEVDLAEDPKDGAILVAADANDMVWIDLGRKNKVAAGQRFTVWRPGKGNIRENIAVVRVTKVGETSSEARIVSRGDTPVVKGMNISNPFYNPTRPLRVHIYGDLHRYTTDTAKARLAASGVIVADALDDTVEVIVLGEPPAAAGDADEDPASAERKARIDRAKRLDEVMEKARAIGAIVVSEDVLSTFIDW